MQTQRSTQFLNEKDVSSIIGVATPTLRRWRLFGRGPRFHKFNNLVRYQRSDLEAWLNSRPQGGEPVSASRAAQV